MGCSSARPGGAESDFREGGKELDAPLITDVVPCLFQPSAGNRIVEHSICRRPAFAPMQCLAVFTGRQDDRQKGQSSATSVLVGSILSASAHPAASAPPPTTASAHSPATASARSCGAAVRGVLESSGGEHVEDLVGGDV